MTEALLVSNAVLWLVVVGLAATVLALARQVGVLHERVAPVGALAPSAGIRAGEAAPELELTDFSGKPLRLGGAAAQRTLLFFVSPTCPVCKSLLPTVERVARAESPAVRLVVASDGKRDEHEAFVRDHDLLRFPYVLSTELGMAYRVGRLPYLVLIDEAGVVRAQGLVNTREHVESLFEAERRGVGTMQEYLEERH
ncbi:MAG: methylamine dehydrogenase accessory protein MauD [Myxococcota bacterium]|nr:methylamine dehydrogenase accessory protein MauD [Myxococcota bacterium]